MKNEITKQDQNTKAAYGAGRDAIIKQLGKDASKEQVIDVVMLLAHSLLTHGEKLDLNISTHNAAVFCDRLKQLIETTQKNIHSKSYAGRLM